MKNARKNLVIGMLFLGGAVMAQPGGNTNTTGTNQTSVLNPQTGGPLDEIYPKDNAPNRRVIPYTYLREADVMWKERVWRVLDMREKVNLPLYYPTKPIEGRRSLFDVLKDGIMSGSLIAYANPAFDDEFKVPMTKTEVVALMSKVDTAYVPDLNNPDQMVPKIIKTDVSADQIRKYWMKEDWFFDKQRSVMDVRILGICPLNISYSDQGTEKGIAPMFWIYFPAAKPLFANAEVFDVQNDAQWLTLEDIFTKRKFASYAYKKNNVYNRQLDDYTTGLNTLIEADKIKNHIFLYEHDMWHF
ncbi:MAG: gliding motility protein GldN [Bacteroidia bacterium]